MWTFSRQGTNPEVMTSNWIRKIRRYRVARHNMPVMFINGLDFPVNFLNPRLPHTTCTEHTHTHTPFMLLCHDRHHVVLIQSCVMKLAQARAGPYYMYYVSVFSRGCGWMTDRAVALIWSDLIRNTRNASASQRKPLNSQCHLSDFIYLFCLKK